MANRYLKERKRREDARRKAPKFLGGTDREQRLARRYPALQNVPPTERQAIVRGALIHPVVLGTVLAFGLLILPDYLALSLRILNIENEPNSLIMIAKTGLMMLLPLCILTPILTKLVMPLFIRKAMQKRGYDPDVKE